MKFLHQWILTVDTPFGKEEYLVDIVDSQDRLTAIIKHEKGLLESSDVHLSDNKMEINIYTEIPIRCNVQILGTINNRTIDGTVLIDEYLNCNFSGEDHAINI